MGRHGEAGRVRDILHHWLVMVAPYISVENSHRAPYKASHTVHIQECTSSSGYAQYYYSIYFASKSPCTHNRKGRG